MQTRILAVLCSLLCIHAFGQTFPCDGRMLLSFNRGGAPNYTYKIIQGSFGVFYYNEFLVFPTGNFNAVGFNPRDNFIYATQANTNTIVRIKADASYEVIGSTSEVEILNSSAGDCNIDGLYMCHDHELDQILVFDVVDNFELLNRIDLFWDPKSNNSGPVTTRLDDFAFDPNNPTLAYSYHGDYLNADLAPATTKGYLLKINLDLSDPNVGMVTPVVKIPTEDIRQIGSLMFTKEGALYGYGSKIPGPVLQQNILFAIDKNTGTFTEAPTKGPTAVSSDGCSCPYSLTFELSPSEIGVLCTSTGISYTLTINNRFNQGLANVMLSDTFPDGMLIESIDGNHSGNEVAGTGIGTQYFVLTDLEIPARSKIEIEIAVSIIDLPIDFNAHQAILTNLPERFPFDLVSDDPGSIESPGDATRIFVIPQTIEEFAFDITHPSNCSNADDGRVIVSSPTLVPGEQYQVKLRDQNYDERTYDVIIDDDNAFMLDSIIPGEYDLFQITPNTSKCSFAIEDTTINIIAPNYLLDASVESNSPVCQFTPLELSAKMSEAGSVSWKGPELFVSSEFNPSIPSTLPSQSGNYELTATYGYCEQIRNIEVKIASEVNAKIEGPEQYCEGDQVQLVAEGKGDILDFRWSQPGSLDFGNSTNVSSMNVNVDGLYQVIVDNGGCQDTVRKVLQMLTTPKISMPAIIETDFCEPILLQSKITGGLNESYSWSSPEDLSCDDCPDPQLLMPQQTNYSLIVTNENSCRDSVTINVFLSVDNPIYIPNAFSPNSDGINDFFRLTPGCNLSRVIKLSILDRWGGIIYSEGPFDDADSDVFWNGSVRGKIGNPGVYIWKVEIELVNGKTKQINGDVTLLP